MKTDKFGVPRFSSTDIFDALYQGKIDAVADMLCESCEEIQKFNKSAEELGTDKIRVYEPLDCGVEDFDHALQSEWFMPAQYQDLDVLQLCLDRCDSDEARDRVRDEYRGFEQRDMANLLRFLTYLVDFMRKEKIVWGVGRGSSVSSYILYLIGVHKIDPIQYGLDWHEFLR